MRTPTEERPKEILGLLQPINSRVHLVSARSGDLNTRAPHLFNREIGAPQKEGRRHLGASAQKMGLPIVIPGVTTSSPPIPEMGGKLVKYGCNTN